MSYVSEMVDQDPTEKVMYWGALSIWTLVPHLLTGVAFLMLSILAVSQIRNNTAWGELMLPASIALGALGVLILIHTVLRFYTTEIAITNKHLITKPGIIARNGTSLVISRCESCNFNQTMLGRIFRYGSIEVSGAGETNAIMTGISKPIEFVNAYKRSFREQENT